MGISKLAIEGRGCITNKLCVELGQAGLTLAVEDQERVDHGDGIPQYTEGLIHSKLGESGKLEFEQFELAILLAI